MRTFLNKQTNTYLISITSMKVFQNLNIHCFQTMLAPNISQILFRHLNTVPSLNSTICTPAVMRDRGWWRPHTRCSTDNFSKIRYIAVRKNRVQKSTIEYSAKINGTVLYSTVQNSTVNTVQYSTEWYTTVHNGRVQYMMVQYSRVKKGKVQYIMVHYNTVYYST